MGRITDKLNQTKAEGRAALVTYIMAGDPNIEVSSKILSILPEAGADIIEIGMPFSDPIADGPIIQKAAQRAISAGTNIGKILDMVRHFRLKDTDTPIILMGYYNPIHHYGRERFLQDAKNAGVDGFLVADLPLEEKAQLQDPAQALGMDFISLVTPSTSSERIRQVGAHASGFLYYVSVAGVTGTKSANQEALKKSIKHIKENCQLPIAIGFGIDEPSKAKQAGALADAVIVGSVIVDKIISSYNEGSTHQACDDVHQLVSDFAQAIK